MRRRLEVPVDAAVAVSCTGGLSEPGGLLLQPLAAELARRPFIYQLTAPMLSPGAGAAVHAAKLSGSPLARASIERLAQQDRTSQEVLR